MRKSPSGPLNIIRIVISKSCSPRCSVCSMATIFLINYRAEMQKHKRVDEIWTWIIICTYTHTSCARDWNSREVVLAWLVPPVLSNQVQGRGWEIHWRVSTVANNPKSKDQLTSTVNAEKKNQSLIGIWEKRVEDQLTCKFRDKETGRLKTWTIRLSLCSGDIARMIWILNVYKVW